MTTKREDTEMWITLDSKEKTVSNLKCVALSAICTAVLLMMMIYR